MAAPRRWLPLRDFVRGIVARDGVLYHTSVSLMAWPDLRARLRASGAHWLAAGVVDADTGAVGAWSVLSDRHLDSWDFWMMASGTDALLMALDVMGPCLSAGQCSADLMAARKGG